MPEPSPAFAHIISQTRQNIELLITHNQIPQDDGRNILAMLSRAGSPSNRSITALAQKTSRLSLSPSNNRAKVEARALWEWTSTDDPRDLTFHAGEIIEIIDETNEDWWTGCNRAGKQGIFPSAYVEKLRSSSEKVSPPPFPDTPKSDTSFTKTGPVQRYTVSPAPSQKYPASPGPTYHPPPGPPPPQPYDPSPGPLQHYGPPPGPPQQYGPPQHGPPPGPPHQYGPPYYPSTGSPQPAPQQPPKQGKFGNLGTTMAQSAAGGLGFGAGAAIGSDIINSIF